MAFLTISKIFAKYCKGEQGESDVCDSIASILKDKSDKENYYLVPKARLESGGIVFEIDLLLLHPTLGIYIIEVKNWGSLELMHENSPYTQANNYKNIVLSLLKEHFKDCPINVEMRVIFPSISKESAREFFCQESL